MSSDGYNFQKDLENSIFNADPKLNRDELLVDIFKAYVAKLFELVLSRQKKEDRIPFGALVEIKSNLISEFRQASLVEHQQSVKWYEELFETTVQEILNDASLAHQGVETIELDKNQEFSVNPESYVNNGGLFIPKHLKKN